MASKIPTEPTKNCFRVIFVGDAPPAISPYRLIDSKNRPVTKTNDFLDALAARGLSEKTLRSYAYDLLNLFMWLSTTKLTPETLKESHLLDYIRYQCQSRTPQPSPSTINRRLTTTRSLFRYLVGHDIPQGRRSTRPRASLIPERKTLLAHLLRPKHRYKALGVKVPRRVIYPLSDDEVIALLASMRTWRDRSIVLLMLMDGLRSCEVVSLRMNDISFSESTIRVKGKGNKERVIPCPAEVRRAVSNYIHMERPKQTSDAVFVVLKGPNRGRPLTLVGLRSLFRHHRLISGVKKANPHRLRHTFGSNMARAGVPLPVLMQLMGHCQIDSTMQYIEILPDDVRDEFLKVIENLRKKDTPHED